MEDCPEAREGVEEPSESAAEVQQEKYDPVSAPLKRLSIDTPSPSVVPQAIAKVDLLMKATGDAPIMKQKKWAVEADRKISYVISFVKRYLKMTDSESLFIYVNQAFAPSPDQVLKNLYECFGTDGKLVLHYCKSQAWG